MECIHTNTRHTVRYRDARQATATGERPHTNARHAAIGRNHTVLTPRNQSLGCSFNQAVPHRMINLITGCHRDAHQATATVERTPTNARHAVPYRDARQATATTERRRADARYAVRYRDARQATAIGERLIADARHAVWDNQICNKHTIQIQVVCIVQWVVVKRYAAPLCKVGDIYSR